MKKQAKNNIKLGLFVLVGLVVFVAVVYYLGSKQNLFGSTTTVTATFKNVSGLKVGNNVRFAGINVGTVQRIQILSDSTIGVLMQIEEQASQYIKKDSEASISSEGLMGNKIISISSGSQEVASIEDDDQLSTIEPVEIDEVIRTLNRTGENALDITQDISDLTGQVLEGKGFVGKLVADQTLVNRVESIMASLENSATNITDVTRQVNQVTEAIRQGEGTLGKLVYDETMGNQIKKIADSLSLASGNITEVTRELAKFTDQLNNGNGVVDKLVSDSTFAGDLQNTVRHVNEMAAELEVTAEKINNSWLLNGLLGGRDKNEKQARPMRTSDSEEL